MPGEEDDYRASKDPLYKASVGTFASLDKPAALLRCEIFILISLLQSMARRSAGMADGTNFRIAPEIVFQNTVELKFTFGGEYQSAKFSL